MEFQDLIETAKCRELLVGDCACHIVGKHKYSNDILVADNGNNLHLICSGNINCDYDITKILFDADDVARYCVKNYTTKRQWNAFVTMHKHLIEIEYRAKLIDNLPIIH